ncbi:hypothetical protein L9F63_013359, partial [Diploptera punctata]
CRAVRFIKTPYLIQKNGYPVESHHVVTEDGYILTMFRIPYSPKSSAGVRKGAVFLQHGLLGSSAEWILLGPEKSLGYLLADAGYDVWLGNARGNSYSSNHTKYSITNRKFWDFSFHELGVYDIPAEVDYILEKTGEKSIYYIGMSMGTTMYFVFASERPEYNHKIRLMIAMAPVVYMNKATTPLITSALTPLGLGLVRVTDLIGYRRGKINEILSNTVCGNNALRIICINVMFALAGYDYKQLNESLVPYIITYYPEGGSIKCFLHYYQLAKSGGFHQYDYGEKVNMVKYNQRFPPQYNLKAVTSKVALMYAINDRFSHEQNVQELIRVLPNSVEVYKIAEPSFNHFDFIIAKDVKTLVNDHVISILNKY